MGKRPGIPKGLVGYIDLSGPFQKTVRHRVKGMGRIATKKGKAKGRLMALVANQEADQRKQLNMDLAVWKLWRLGIIEKPKEEEEPKAEEVPFVGSSESN